MIQTSWHVITGAPCSGKTTVIKELEHLGYTVVHEVARSIIIAETRKGKSPENIRQSESAFEKKILEEKVRIENNLPPDKTLFLDRAIPDSIAYYKKARLNTKRPIEFGKKFRYKNIFLFDRLHLEKDFIRTENEKDAQYLGKLIGKSYESLGYKIIRIPVLTVNKRVSLVLKHI